MKINLILSDEKLNIWDRIRQRRLVKRLYSTPKDRWIAIRHALNEWEFPPEFYDLIPRWWKYNKLPRKSFAFMSPVIETIDSEFSKKEQLRYHNVSKGRMNNKEFEYWYSLTRFGDDSDKYYKKWQKINEIEWWKDDVFEKISKATQLK